MDVLDRIHPAARALLDRIDATLIAAGAPPDHPVLPLLRRVGALPGDVVAQLAAVTADPLIAAGDALRRQSEGYETGQASAPVPAAWRGPAAESFAARWSTLSGYLAGDSASMAGRLDATASYLDEVGAWLARGRRALAGTLAECLGSAEAATLRGAPAPGAGPTGTGGNIAGIGTAGIGTAGIGAAGIGTAGIGTAGIGTGGIGAAGIGVAGIGVAGIGTAGIGVAGIGAPGIATPGIGIGGGVTAGLAAGPAGTLDGPAATSRDAVRAAADLGAHILGGAAEILDDGQRVLDAWAGRLDDLPYPSQSPTAIGVHGQLEIG